MLGRVLVLQGGGDAGISRFKKGGTGGNDTPRYPQSYPYYGALTKAGVQVDVVSVGGGASTDRKGRKPPGAWQVYFGSLLITPLLSRYDVVVGWGLDTACLAGGPARLWGQSRKLAHISFFTYTKPPSSLKQLARQRIFKSAVRSAGRTILMTQQQVLEAISSFGCEPTRVAHLPVGVDVEFFHPDPSPSEAGIKGELRRLRAGSYVVVAGDQLREESDYLQILTGLGVGLVRLTQNKYTEKFWHAAHMRAEGDFSVLCIAHLSATEVRYAYQRAICAINFVDSTEQPAGWTAMTEAMACGLPVLVNAGLTTQELRRHCSSADPLPFVELCDLDPEEARYRLKRLIDGRQERELLGLRARRFVERHYDIENTSQMALSILEEIAAESRSGAHLPERKSASV